MPQDHSCKTKIILAVCWVSKQTESIEWDCLKQNKISDYGKGSKKQPFFPPSYISIVIASKSHMPSEVLVKDVSTFVFSSHTPFLSLFLFTLSTRGTVCSQRKQVPYIFSCSFTSKESSEKPNYYELCENISIHGNMHM